MIQVKVVHKLQAEHSVHLEGQGVGHQIEEPDAKHKGVGHEEEIESVIFHVIQDTKEDIQTR